MPTTSPPLPTKRFQRHRENFTCEHCGEKVTGDGYTDHCPSCLWSKHVDVNPGDRQATCKGLMEPVGVKFTRGNFDIAYRCTACGFTTLVKSLPTDNRDVLEELTCLPWQS